jgi:hypothetical protein
MKNKDLTLKQLEQGTRTRRTCTNTKAKIQEN